MAFQPRLNSDGMSGSKYWFSSTNPFYPAFGLPNCTCYAWGRAWEITGNPVNLPTGNADTWLETARQRGFEISQTPSLGDIICFGGGLVGTGHVAVVEVINADGSIITSNSNYGAEFFVTYTMIPPGYNNIDSSLSFQGFIHYADNGSALNWIIPTDINSSRALTYEEMQNNAKCFYGTMFLLYGMSLNACCGILGNAQSESTINPARWQGDEPYHQPPDSWGYGLVQWTPYTKILDWLSNNGYPLSDTSKFGEGECKRIKWELDNNQQWIPTATYPDSFQDFWTSTKDPGTLALEFLANYERPFDPNQPIRATQAQAWYDYLKDWEPVLPGEAEEPTKKKKGMPLWFYLKRRYR